MLKQLLCVCLAMVLLTGCAGKEAERTEVTESETPERTTKPFLISAAVTDSAETEAGETLRAAAASAEGISVTFYDEETAGSAADMLAGVKLGTVGMLVCNAAEFAEQHPEWSLFTLPGLFTDAERFNEWARSGPLDHMNDAFENGLTVLAAVATGDRYLYVYESFEEPNTLSTYSTGNVFNDLYWKSAGVTVKSELLEKRNALSRNVNMIPATRALAESLSLERGFSGIVPTKTGLGCIVVVMNRAAWERLTDAEKKTVETYMDRIYTAIAARERADDETYAAGQGLAVFTPSYRLREKLLERDKVVNKYKEVLGADYVDYFLESVSRFNNKYTAG